MIIKTMYEFNACGVCTNPDCIDIDKNNRIKLAKEDGMWIMGYDLDYISGGVGCPCCSRWHKFKTRKEAMDAALKEAIKHMERQIKWYSRALSTGSEGSSNGYGASLKQCHVILQSLKDMQKQKTTPIQLSLFD